jgi:predicted short-subunit dehydrogenase-like oxidoreductase (DUF2520 family)
LRELLLDGLPGGRVRVLESPREALGARLAVLLCLPGAVIVDMAEELARSVARGGKRPVVLHTNGLLGKEALDSLRDKGMRVGKLHPLAPIPEHGCLFGSVAFGVEGDPGALRAARAIVRWIGGRPLLLRRGSGPEYHAAASLFCGGLVALYELADRLFRRVLPSRDARRRALGSLAWPSLFHAYSMGARAALTGAISRGAEDTVRQHLRTLQRSPEALEAYRVLGRTMLELGRERGSVDAPTARRLARLLGSRARRR